VAFPKLPDVSKLERYVALVIKFDPETGWRPGDIDVRKEAKNLFCFPLWQDLEKNVEMRLILDVENIDRYIERFSGVEGIEIVEGKEAINAKVRELFKPRYLIAQPFIMQMSIAAKKIRIDDISPDLPLEEVARILYERGALGIGKMEPYTIP